MNRNVRNFYDWEDDATATFQSSCNTVSALRRSNSTHHSWYIVLTSSQLLMFEHARVARTRGLWVHCPLMFTCLGALGADPDSSTVWAWMSLLLGTMLEGPFVIVMDFYRCSWFLVCVLIEIAVYFLAWMILWTDGGGHGLLFPFFDL